MKISADEYLNHRYEAGELPRLPLADEDFAREWEIWLDNPETSPSDVKDILSDETVASRLEKSTAGKIPVLYTRSRVSFERAAEVLYPNAFPSGIPSSVNAFTIKAKHPGLQGHRVILLNKAGYSALSENEVNMGEEAWLEKSMTIRLNHEICHYFSLRVLGGMQNHVLDEIAADCAGQLAAFGVFSAPLQKLFFGISEGGVAPGGRFSFYIKRLNGDSADAVLEETNAALLGLETYLSENPDAAMPLNRPSLTVKILSAGVRGLQKMQKTRDIR